ncbi:MAG: glycosyltransferase family 39 protein [Bacteroidia bacterium]
MKQLWAELAQRPAVLRGICVLLLIPAFFINLGLMPLLADESIRAMVSLEMIISGNYITPTMSGEFYYNKPPLYNWILAGLFQLTGSFSELVVRLPSVVPLLLFGLTIFWFVKKHLGFETGFLAALLTVTCGRMVVYASMLGHIDLFYSLVTYASFIVIYEGFRKEKWWFLFLVSYGLVSIGFLSKGLPSLVFQGFTLLAYFIIKKDFKRLFSIQHICGFLLFLLVVGTYFYVYHQYNSLEAYLTTLWTQSSQRTVLEKEWYESFLHLFVFPFDTLYHILPWSLLVIYAARRGFWRLVMKHDFLQFNFIVLFANIWVYWLSPETLPRYIFMLYPLIFTIICWFYVQYREEDRKRTKVLHSLLFVLISAITLALLVPFFQLPVEVPYRYGKSIALFLGAAFLVWAFIKIPRQRLIIAVMVLLIGRIGFNWFVLPERQANATESRFKEEGIVIARLSEGRDVKFVGPIGPDLDIRYYIQRENKTIVRYGPGSANRDTTSFYISTQRFIDDCPHQLIHSFHSIPQNTTFFLVKYEEPCMYP